MAQKVVVKKGMAGIPELPEAFFKVVDEIADHEAEMSLKEIQDNLRCVAMGLGTVGRIVSQMSAGGKTVEVTSD